MKVTIVGGGIAGLTIAVALQRAGIDYTLFEAAGDIKPVGAGLGLGANAIKGYERLGIADDVIAAGRQLNRFVIYDEQGKVITQTNTDRLVQKFGINNFAIHRWTLHQVLLKHTDLTKVKTGKRLTGFTKLQNGYILTFADGTTHEAEFIIAADGIHSLVRRALLPQSNIRYAGYTCWRGVINNEHLGLNETSETWGRAGRFGIVPLANHQLYWFACITAPANYEAYKKYTVSNLQQHFGCFHAGVQQVLTCSVDEPLLHGDIIDLQPIYQFAFDNVVLTGDAAHATTPNMGQGACQAVEDAVVLADEMKNNSNWSVAFKRYELRRIKRVHFVVNRSYSIGAMVQCSQPLLISLRNAALRMVPASVNESQLAFLYRTDF